MARRAASFIDDEPIKDAWSETWGDRALQDLGRRLVEYGLTEEQAAQIVEQTWLFYSYVALPELQKRFPMGIATKQSDIHPAVYLYLTFGVKEGTLGRELGVEHFPAIKESFEELFATPVQDIVEMHLEPFVTSEPWIAYFLSSRPEEFDERLVYYAASHNLHYVGVFVDDLEAELKTVMDPEMVLRWLETPNSLFVGRKPAEFLNVPHDRQLRDVITRAKFNLPAA